MTRRSLGLAAGSFVVLTAVAALAGGRGLVHDSAAVLAFVLVPLFAVLALACAIAARRQ